MINLLPLSQLQQTLPHQYIFVVFYHLQQAMGHVEVVPILMLTQIHIDELVAEICLLYDIVQDYEIIVS